MGVVSPVLDVVPINVVQTNKPYLIFDGLCNLFMVIWGMVYGIVFYHIMSNDGFP